MLPIYALKFSENKSSQVVSPVATTSQRPLKERAHSRRKNNSPSTMPRPHVSPKSEPPYYTELLPRAKSLIEVLKRQYRDILGAKKREMQSVGISTGTNTSSQFEVFHSTHDNVRLGILRRALKLVTLCLKLKKEPTRESTEKLWLDLESY